MLGHFFNKKEGVSFFPWTFQPPHYPQWRVFLSAGKSLSQTAPPTMPIISQSETKNPRINQLSARWQQVWLLALERQRRLNDALDRLEEVTAVQGRGLRGGGGSGEGTASSLHYQERWGEHVALTPIETALCVSQVATSTFLKVPTRKPSAKIVRPPGSLLSLSRQVNLPALRCGSRSLCS